MVDRVRGARRGLGDRLGPIRVQLISARDEGMVELILGSLDPESRVAFDLEHPSWDGIEPELGERGAVRVNDLDHRRAVPVRALSRPAVCGRPTSRRGPSGCDTVSEPVFAYFRHEDEPTAPGYAKRLLELLG